MFAPSTTTVSGAIYEITDTVGASGDSDMRTRALRSLQAGIKYLNGRQNWSWLMTEAAPIGVVAPFMFTIAASAGQSSATGTGLTFKVDDLVVGSGYALGTRVTALGSTTAVGFNTPVTGYGAGVTTATVTGVRDFYDLPSDWKQPYSVRTLKNFGVLYPAQRRAYDRNVIDEFSSTSIPMWYDLFAGFQKGKIRLLPPPSTSDNLQLRYFRRMTVPTTTATADVLDIPQDYDFHLMAWAKWHFLTDKGDGRQQQAATWLSLAQDGIKVMLNEQTRQPDETLAFPGRGNTYGDWNLTSTRWLPWDYA